MRREVSEGRGDLGGETRSLGRSRWRDEESRGIEGLQTGAKRVAHVERLKQARVRGGFPEVLEEEATVEESPQGSRNGRGIPALAVSDSSSTQDPSVLPAIRKRESEVRAGRLGDQPSEVPRARGPQTRRRGPVEEMPWVMDPPSRRKRGRREPVDLEGASRGGSVARQDVSASQVDSVASRGGSVARQEASQSASEEASGGLSKVRTAEGGLPVELGAEEAAGSAPLAEETDSNWSPKSQEVDAYEKAVEYFGLDEESE